MDNLKVTGKFIGYTENKMVSAKGKEYVKRVLSVFIDDVGKVDFSFAGLAFTQDDIEALSQAKLRDSIVLYCAIDVGQYKTPILVATGWELA